MSRLLGFLLAGGSTCALVNERNGAVVASVVEAAVDSRSRRRGLLGRDGLPERHALLLAPCSAIHTCFMRFPIDVLFVTRDGRVLKTVERLGAWRIALSPRAFATIELPAGSLGHGELVPGDQVAIRPAFVRETSFPS